MKDQEEHETKGLKWVVAITTLVSALVLINLSIELTILMLR